MKRLLAVACAATLLTGGLTACTVRENPVHTNTNGVTNSKIPMDDNATTNSGTDMSPSDNGTIYPDASDLARSGYDRMRSDRIWYDGKSDGRYTAYSDGAVSPGGTGNLIQDGKNLGRDLMNGTKNVVDSVRDTVRDLGGIPHGGDVPPYE